MSFSIERTISSGEEALINEVTGLLGTGNWSGARVALSASRWSGSLPLAKLAARAQLMGEAPAAAVAVLEPLAHLLDDEGQRLLAAALARAERPWDAVRVYRALIVAAPDDATVWMGLALALDATGTDRTAVVYAYQQARALSHDARLSRLAELRLAALA